MVFTKFIITLVLSIMTLGGNRKIKPFMCWCRFKNFSNFHVRLKFVLKEKLFIHGSDEFLGRNWSISHNNTPNVVTKCCYTVEAGQTLHAFVLCRQCRIWRNIPSLHWKLLEHYWAVGSLGSLELRSSQEWFMGMWVLVSNCRYPRELGTQGLWQWWPALVENK